MSTGSGGASAPPYLARHSGPVIVCGSGWTLRDDLSRARDLFPDAPAIAVNGAAGQVGAFALFSQHPVEMPRWIARHQALGGGFTVHAAGTHHLRDKLGHEVACPWVDHWWDGVASRGSSVWGARRLAARMGFGPVVLCGAPLAPGPYANRDISKTTRAGFGRYRAAILADPDMHAGVIGMSGWLKEVFPCGS